MAQIESKGRKAAPASTGEEQGFWLFMITSTVTFGALVVALIVLG